MPLSCAIVGATSLLPLPAISIRAVCDPSEADGKALAAALECPWYPSPQDMLTAQPGLESLWLRPDSSGKLPFDPIMLASFGRHLFLDLSLPITGEAYTQMASVAYAKGATIHAIFPSLPSPPAIGELYALEIRGFLEEYIPSPIDQLPFSLNQGLSVLLSVCGPALRVQGCFDVSATGRHLGHGGPDKIGLLVSFPSGVIGQLLLLPASDSVDPRWTVSVTGSEGSYTFRLPAEPSPVWTGDFPTPYDPALYPALLALRKGISDSFRQGGASVFV